MRKLIFRVLGALMMAGTLMAQVEPNAGNWKTRVISSGGTYRLAAPPNSEITATELRWVKDCMSLRDAAAVTSIHYWDAGSPGYRWMQLAEQSVVEAGLPTPLQTRALALVAAAISDAMVAARDSKYTYNRAHPSELDSTVAPVVALPKSPSYPSEHAVAAGAAAAVLEYLFPDQNTKLVSDERSNGHGAATRELPDLGRQN